LAKRKANHGPQSLQDSDDDGVSSQAINNIHNASARTHDQSAADIDMNMPQGCQLEDRLGSVHHHDLVRKSPAVDLRQQTVFNSIDPYACRYDFINYKYRKVNLNMPQWISTNNHLP